MLKKITDEIFQLVVRFPFGMREVNCYLLKSERGFTVVDTGSRSEESIEIWKQTLASGIKIEKLVLTHAHPDHIGLAGWFQKHLKVPVYISRLGYLEMQKMRRLYQGENPFSMLSKMHGGPEISKRLLYSESSAYNFEPDGLFENNQKIELGAGVFETIWTPGHSPDHFCFFHRHHKLMIIGDHVLKDFSPIVGFSSDLAGNPLKDYFSSLALIKEYPVTLALPGHGGHIHDLKNRIEEIASRHQHRLRQVLESVGHTGKTARQVCEEIYGELSGDQLFSPFISIITRLTFLESAGKVNRETRNGKIIFSAVTET